MSTRPKKDRKLENVRAHNSYFIQATIVHKQRVDIVIEMLETGFTPQEVIADFPWLYDAVGTACRPPEDSVNRWQ